MKKALQIFLLIQTISLAGQFPADSFEVIFQCDFENDEAGLYSSDDWTSDWPNNLGYFVNHDDVMIVENMDSKAMRFEYIDGTSNMVDKHGAKFYSHFDKSGTAYEEIYFTYDVMFKPGFDFVRSGKIPSLGVEPGWEGLHSYPFYDEGSSPGIRWSGTGSSEPSVGRLFAYIYSHNLTALNEETGKWEQGTWGPQWMNPDKPDEILWIQPDSERWINITIRVVMNSVNPYGERGDANGIMEGFINGKLAFSNDTVIWRNVEGIGVSLMRIYSQFGGIGDIFNTSRDEWILLDNFRAWRYSNSVKGVPRGRETSSWGRDLNLPASWSNATEISGMLDNKDIHSPSIPENIQVIGLTENSASIKWSAATDNIKVTEYRIYINDEFDGATDGTSYEITGLSPGTEYLIKVTAIDATGNESEQSDPIKVTTKSEDNEPPSIPQDVSVTGLTESSISLTWGESSDDVAVSGYNIFVDKKKKGTSINNNYLASGLSPDTKYEIAVSAFDTKGNESAQSDAIQVRTEDPDESAPTAPTKLSAETVTETSIYLVWNASSDNVSVAGYHITANGLRRGTSLTNSYQLTQLNPGIEYIISVSAYDASGNLSTPSNQILVYTKNPDVTVQPSLPEIELVEIEKTHSSASAVTEVKSFGYTELQDYGIIISQESEEILNGKVVYGSPDSTLVINDKRVTSDLEVLLNFSESKGNVIRDISENENDIELKIDRELNTIWQRGQGLKVIENTIITSNGSLKNLINKLNKSGEVTLEAWVKSSDVNQAGPASILSFSAASNEKGFSLGQKGNLASYNYALGYRTLLNEPDETSEIVSSENFVHPGLHHIIFTRDRIGREKLYVNGLESYSGINEADLFDLNSVYKLVLANEITGQNPWLGTYYLLAIYSKALSSQEVNQNYVAGFGTLQFKSVIAGLEPNVQYHISPFVRTDQGIVYGEAESFMVENIRIPEDLDNKDTLLIAVFPNPSSGTFTVEFEDTGETASSAVVQIADHSGQIMYVKEYPLGAGLFAGKETICLDEIINRKGFYSIIVIMGEKYAASKLIII